MLFLGLAVVFGVFSIIAGSAKKRGFSLTFGIVAMLSFITWLNMIGALTWLENPSVNIPDNIHVPGQE